MLTGRKYRLSLTTDQTAYAEQIAGACRSVWNAGLEQRRAYRRRGGWINYIQQAREMAEAEAEHTWLKDVPGHVLQQTLMDLDKACRRHGTWKVQWKSKVRSRVSFRFPEGGKIPIERLNRKWARARLPKIGWVTFRWTRPLGGAIRSATLSRDGNQWFVSFLVETGEAAPTVSLERGRIGVDRGAVVAAATDDGRFFDQHFIRPGEAERYRRLEKQRARTRQGSKRRRDCVSKQGVIMRRVRNRRRDFHARTAARIVDGNALIVLEDLKTKNTTVHAERARWCGKSTPRTRRRHARRAGRRTRTPARAKRSSSAPPVPMPSMLTPWEQGTRWPVDIRVTGRGDLGTSRSVKRQPTAGATRWRATSAVRLQSPGFSCGEERQ
jgi:putative transposase